MKLLPKHRRRSRISLIDYSKDSYQEKTIKSITECFPFKNKPTVTWINIDGLQQRQALEQLGKCYGLHPLVIEDIYHTRQRPKLEDYGEYIYIVLRMVYYQNNNINQLASEQISLILSSGFVISFQEGIRGDVFDPVRSQIKTGKNKISKLGTDYLCYSLIDAIVDNYFTVIEKLGDKIEDVEEKLLHDPDSSTLQDINNLKRIIIDLRRSIWPLREVIGRMQREESPLINENTKIYLRDIYDHTVLVIENVETLRDILAGMIEIYLSTISNKMNEIMKVLTMIATIFIPLTFIVGLYGMNFEFMPELRSPWGYPAVLVIMAMVAISMLIYFRKKKWI
ncbi:MAG: magnesium/cobalt transporter CorA [Patescibacteria group bacterium]|jgi:magnesium transporter